MQINIFTNHESRIIIIIKHELDILLTIYYLRKVVNERVTRRRRRMYILTRLGVDLDLDSYLLLKALFFLFLNFVLTFIYYHVIITYVALVVRVHLFFYFASRLRNFILHARGRSCMFVAGGTLYWNCAQCVSTNA